MNHLTTISLNPCSEVLADLEGFIDGELPGQSRLRVAEHLEACASCAAELNTLAGVGELLRAAALPEADIDARVLGLGSRVVGRVRAEERMSWRRMLAQACDGWHWTIVGAGSVMGTFVTTSVLSLILAFGPTPAREDSLSALIGNLASPPGYLFIEVASGNGPGTEMLQVANGQPTASKIVAAFAVPSARRSEAEVVDELAATVTRDGRVLSLAAMDRQTRERTEALFTELTQIALRRRQAVASDRTLSVKGLRLVTSITATAKS
jgi:anti-sigma factor RsiW